MADGDRTAVAVDPGVVVGDAEVVQEAEHLDGEGLVDFEQADVRNAQPGVLERLLGGRDRADAHDLRFDAGEGVADQAHLDRQAEFPGGVGGGQQGGGGAVVEAGGVAGGDATVGAERGLERGEVGHRGARPRRLVHGVHGPALARLHGGDRHQVRLDLVVRVGGGQLVLGSDGVSVGAVLGDGGETVVQVLGGVAHVQGGRVHDPFGHKARVGVRAGAHRVVAHVLDAAGDHDVVRAEADAARRGGHGGHGAGAHPVDREAGHGPRQPGQQGGGAADGQALVAGLGGGGDGHLVDPLGRQGRVAAHQFADALDHEVIGAGSGVDAFLAGAAEGGADTVDEDDVADGTVSADGRLCTGGSAAVTSAARALAHVVLLIETWVPVACTGRKRQGQHGSGRHQTTCYSSVT